PPSSGTTTISMLLAMLERFPMGKLEPLSPRAVHLFSEAGRLAYADRDRYLGDPDFVPVPIRQLLDRGYLAGRSALPGAARFGPDSTLELESTTHFSVIDSAGNVVAMTSSVESAFGSRIL